MLFFFKIVLVVWTPLRFHINFRRHFSIYAKKNPTVFWDFDRDCIEYADNLMQCWLLNNIKYFSSWISFYICVLYKTTWPASWETCMQVRKQQLELYMEQQTGSKEEKKYVKAVYCHPPYLTYMQCTSWETLGWMKHKLEWRLPA